MAIVKHIKSRNANYSAAINYLLFEHDEKTGKTFPVSVLSVRYNATLVLSYYHNPR